MGNDKLMRFAIQFLQLTELRAYIQTQQQQNDADNPRNMHES